MGDITGVVKSSRDLLKGRFAKSRKKLGDWDFDVSETVAKTVKKEEKAT